MRRLLAMLVWAEEAAVVPRIRRVGNSFMIYDFGSL